MPYSFYLQSELSNLATTLASVPNGSDVYISKNSLGVVSAYNVERATTLNNFGYPFQFIDGSVSYTTLPITSLASIPWTYPYTTLTASSANLWNSSLMLWLDAFETKSINTSLQKIVSKDYTNNLVIVENTDNNSFLYTSPNLSLTSNSSLESSTVQTVYAYFKLAMVFTLGTQVLNTVLFQHNRLKIKLTSQTAPDNSTQSMIGIFDNDVFKKGIKLNSSNLGFKYQLYTDNLGTLFVSGNTSVNLNSTNYYQATTAKIYIGSDSTKNYPANMILHELLLYESASNDISATFSNISTYFTSRHTLTTYNDTSNIYPTSWLNPLSKGNRTSTISISSNVFPRGGPNSEMVNGNFSSNGPWGADSCVGQYYMFDLGNSYTINGFKLFNSGSTTLEAGRIGYFNFEGSNNNSTWTTLTTNFIWCDNTSPDGINLMNQTSDADLLETFSSVSIQTKLFFNTTAYRYYRFIGTSGNWNSSPYYNGICFKVG